MTQLADGAPGARPRDGRRLDRAARGDRAGASRAQGAPLEDEGAVDLGKGGHLPDPGGQGADREGPRRRRPRPEGRRARGGGAPPLRRRPEAAEGPRRGQPPPRRAAARRRDAQGRGRRGGHRRDRLEVDRDPGGEDARGGDSQARPPRGGAASPRRGSGRRRLGRRHGGPPRALRAQGPRPPGRLVRLPRPDGSREDRARQGARGVPFRRRAGDDPARHVRVPGAAHGGADDRRSSRLRRLRGGRPAHRGGPPPAVRRGSARRDREGARGGVQPPAAGPRRRAAHRRQGPHGGLPEHDPDHDLEPGLGLHPGPRRRGPGAAARTPWTRRSARRSGRSS